MIVRALKNPAKEYQTALEDYVAGAGESALENAYMIGRAALEQRLAPLEIATTHHRALGALLRHPDLSAKKSQKIVKQAGNFLAECLSPYAMAQRGYQETIDALQSLNESLEDEIARRTQALRDSEERYRTLIQISPDAISVTDVQGRIVLCNEQSARLHGFRSPDEAIGIDVSGLVAPEDFERVRQMALRALEAGSIQDLEYTLLTQNGNRVPVEVRVSLIKDANSQPTGFIGIIRDITARRRAEEERRQLIAENERQRERLSTLVANVPGVVWEAWGEPDVATQRIDFVSDHVEKMLGYTVQEWLSTPNFWLTIVHPDDKEAAASRSRELFASRQPGANEFRWIAKDGRKLWVQAQSVVITDESGEPAGMRGVTLDITSRKEAELLLEAQARQQAAVAQLGQRALSELALESLIHEAVHLVAQTLDVEFCELLELLPDGESLILRDGIGWREGSIGIASVPTSKDSQAGYTLQASQAVIVENLASETRFRPPSLLMDHGVASGITIVIEGKGRPYGVLGAHTRRQRLFTREEGNFLQSIANVLAMAIANRRLLESEAKRREAAEHDNDTRIKALAIVSHELRTPLASIKGFASTLLADDISWDAASQRDFILTINQESDKLANLLGQLLDLTRMDAGVFEIKAIDQSISDLLSASMLRIQALTSDHKLAIEASEPLPLIKADTQRIEQVLANLVENAAKYSPSGSQITISVKANDEFAQVSVSDEGRGIPAQEREKVFQPFYRTLSVSGMNKKGAGLGLTICRRLIESHGGRIWVEGHDGPGTTISFLLPFATAREGEGQHDA